MRVSRRRVLVGAAAVTAVTLAGRLTVPKHALDSDRLPIAPIMPGGHALILHDGGAAALQLVRSVRAAAVSRRVREFAPAMLTVAGFMEAGARVNENRGGDLLSLLDEADTIVVEALLRTVGAVRMTRHRHGRQVLLSAHLGRKWGDRDE